MGTALWAQVAVLSVSRAWCFLWPKNMWKDKNQGSTSD